MGTGMDDLRLMDSSVAVVASPDPAFRGILARSVGPGQRPAREARGGAEALALLDGIGCGTLLLDRWLPDLEVNELVEIVRRRYPGIQVVVVDSKDDRQWVPGEVPSDTLPGGSLLYASTPMPTLRSLQELVKLPAKLAQTRREEDTLPEMVGRSEPMREVCRLARLVAPRNTPVLITGETGTGKELIARGIHAVSRRAKQRFVVVNCAAIPDTLLEAELFGYTRGAFTGAFQSRVGRIQAAQGGTLLLDEIGELPLSMQAKLLRFLQEGEVQPLGSSDVFRVDVRIVASTNADLATRLREGRFREDLFYRLMVFPIEVSPLRKRVCDIRPLAEHFLSMFSREAARENKILSPGACAVLERHVWPGNVRELRHAIERAFILSEDDPEIGPEHLQFLASAHTVREVLSAPLPRGNGNAFAA